MGGRIRPVILSQAKGRKCKAYSSRALGVRELERMCKDWEDLCELVGFSMLPHAITADNQRKGDILPIPIHECICTAIVI
jgi:hypothetical protein